MNDKPEWQKQIDELIHPTPEQEIAELRGRLAWWQHAAHVRATLRFEIEAKLANVEKELRVANAELAKLRA